MPETPKDKPEQPAKPVTEFKIRKGLNAYGFIHIPKKAIDSLPFQPKTPLKAKIEGDALIIQSE